jgi:hypothetical protein
MNEVDRQVAELQAQVGNKAKQEYFVEVESEDIASQTEENEIEIPQERKTFEVEVDETQEDPVVEDKSKQEEVKDEEEPKEDSKNKYSKSVQKRFDEYAYQLGESRRREEEAIQIAQAIKAERDKIQEELGKLNSGYVTEMGGRLTGSMEAAKAKLKKAMEDQDYDAVANAQIEIGRLGAEQSQYEQMKAQQEVRAKAPKQEREVEIPKAPQQQPVKDPKAEVWASENEWFGTDKVMTNVAYAIHEDLVNQGVDPRTDYYYSEIDKRMRENLPHKFEQKFFIRRTRTPTARPDCGKRTSKQRHRTQRS